MDEQQGERRDTRRSVNKNARERFQNHQKKRSEVLRHEAEKMYSVLLAHMDGGCSSAICRDVMQYVCEEIEQRIEETKGPEWR
jgi:hypothetical protein